MSIALHIWGTIWLSFMFLKWQYLQVLCFFSFFLNILIFWVHRGVKGQKTFRNDKKLCLLCSISKERYIIWLSFMVQMWKMIISPGVFFYVKILIFQVVKGLKGQKMTQNVKKFCLSHLIFQELYITTSSFCGTHVYITG